MATVRTDPITERLRPLHGGRILDVATGFGGFLKLLTESFADFTEAVGIDFSRRITEAAKKKSDPRLNYREMDAEKIEYDDGYFDTVAIRNSLHHLTHIEPVLAEMKRVLRPRGLMLIGEVFQDPATERSNSQRHLHHWWAEADQALGFPHYATFTREQIAAIVHGLGLKIEEQYDWFEESTEAEMKEGLDFMLNHTREMIAKLEADGDHRELIGRGRELIDRFGRAGFVDEGMVYVLARKPG